MLFAGGGILASSCSRDVEPPPFVLDEATLNAKGKAFMDDFKTRPDWEREWQEICETGTPLPNEVVCTFSLSAPDEPHAVMPVVAEGEITRFVFFPLTGSSSETRNTDAPIIGTPEIMDEQAVSESMVARTFIKSKVIDDWVGKGYKLSFKLPEPEDINAHNKQVETRAIGGECSEIAHLFNVLVVYEYDSRWYTESAIEVRMLEFILSYFQGVQNDNYSVVRNLGPFSDLPFALVYSLGYTASCLTLFSQFEDNLMSYLWNTPGVWNIVEVRIDQGLCTSGGGGSPSNPTNPPTNPPTYSEKAEMIADKLKAALIDKIEELNDKLGEIRTDDNPFSDTNTAFVNGDGDFIFDSTKDVWIYIPDGLTDIQMKIILAHEFGHLELLEISRDAGSMSQLYTDNRALWMWMNGSSDFNYSHHKYMGENHADAEQRLRDAFPGEDAMFYEAGKWGGGLINSVGFSELPKEEQQAIREWLQNNNL
jgi:hypothetical protein